MIGDERRHADAEVDVEAVAQFAGDALDDAFALFDVFPGLAGLWSWSDRVGDLRSGADAACISYWRSSSRFFSRSCVRINSPWKMRFT